MKTYLKILFNSEGDSPSEIKDMLLNMGFKATKGNYDFVYEWNKESTGVEVDELVWFADKVHSALKNSKVYFDIETI
ncbi:MAG: hypothetical protein U9R21_06295 [Candidatus Thermoplasmatota archaeon]|nr:hypothetical protein [Candidatus Thermoplasmatota archaeon]